MLSKVFVVVAVGSMGAAAFLFSPDALMADPPVPAKRSVSKASQKNSANAKRKKASKKSPSPHQDLIDRLTKPVVGIIVTEATSGTSENSEEKIDGSGFVVDSDGFIVTNFHVIDGASRVDVVLQDGSRHTARIVGTDSNSDIALLKIDVDHKLPCVSFADSDESYLTMRVYAVGYPFGFGMSITSGIISAKMRGLPNQIGDVGINVPFLQTDAHINYGNSGGPLFTQDGRVVGMVTVFVAEGSQNTGISFAIPSNLLKRNIEQLKTYGKLRKSWIGFLAIPLDREVASALGLGEHHAFAVVSVENGSPADEAGICPGDLILSINGDDVTPATNLEYTLSNLPIDEVISIVAVRSKQEMTFDVKVGIKSDDGDAEHEESETGAVQPISYQEIDCLSIGVTDLTNKLRDHFGIPRNINGVLIANVGKRHSRMSVGNVILSINQKRVAHAACFMDEIKNLTLSKAPSVVFEVYDPTRQVPWFYVKFALIYGIVPNLPLPPKPTSSN